MPRKLLYSTTVNNSETVLTIVVCFRPSWLLHIAVSYPNARSWSWPTIWATAMTHWCSICSPITWKYVKCENRGRSIQPNRQRATKPTNTSNWFHWVQFYASTISKIAHGPLPSASMMNCIRSISTMRWRKSVIWRAFASNWPRMRAGPMR